MPNVKGGKNYKKSKNSGQTEPDFFERQDDQMYARVIKLLGNCNVLVFCNDGKRRLCHIRGGLRKKVWLNVGDLVLMSLREFGSSTVDGSAMDKWERGDIISKYDSMHIGKLKKDPEFNQILLNQVEKLSDDSDAWDKIMYKPGSGVGDSAVNILNGIGSDNNDDGFEFDNSGGLEDAEDKDESHDERNKPNHAKGRENKQLGAQFETGYIASSLQQKKTNIDDIDIDAI